MAWSFKTRSMEDEERNKGEKTSLKMRGLEVGGFYYARIGMLVWICESIEGNGGMRNGEGR
jgi:hypothetical protein